MFTKRQLARLIVPLILEQMLMGTVGAFDVVMVGVLGETAVSGVSLVTSIDQLVLSAFSALAAGGAIVCSQYLGSRQLAQGRLCAVQLLCVAGAFGGAVGLLCLAGGGPLLRLLYGGAEQAVLQQARRYFVFAALSYPVIALFNAVSALMRSIERTKTAMYVSFGMNGANLLLNALLIYGLSWGVAGAGAASFLSRLGGLFVLYAMLIKSGHPICPPAFSAWRIEAASIRKILQVGVPAGVEGAVFHVGKLLVQSVVTACGTAAIAANAVALTLTEFLHTPGAGIGLALITVVGQCIGANEKAQARRYTRNLIALAYAVMGVLDILVFFFAPLYMALYPGIEAQTAALAISVLRWHSVVCFFFWPMGFTMVSALRAAGDVKFPMVVSIASMWVFRVGCSYLLMALCPQWGLLNVWFAMFLDWVFRALVYWLRYRSDIWLNKRVI